MNHGQSSSSSNTHLLIMLACCLIPLGLILAIGVFGFSLGSLTPLLPYALVLLCPLMMIFMMRGMSHDHGEMESHHAEHSRARAPAIPSNAAADAAAQNTEGGERCH